MRCAKDNHKTLADSATVPLQKFSIRFYPLVMMMVAGKADPLPSLDGAVSVMLADVQPFSAVLCSQLCSHQKHLTHYQ